MPYTPAWQQRLAQAYLNETKIAFVLHGETLSTVRLEAPEGVSYQALKTYLAERLFRQRELVLYYDRAAGIQPRGDADQTQYQAALTSLNVGEDAQKRAKSSAGRAFLLLDSIWQQHLKAGRSGAMIIDFAETLLPAAGLAGDEEKAVLGIVMEWLGNRLFLEADFTLVLLAGHKNDLQARLLAHPALISIAVDKPNEEERQSYLAYRLQGEPTLAERLQLTMDTLAVRTKGLTLQQLDELLDAAANEPITEQNLSEFRRRILHTEPAPAPLVADDTKPEWVRQLENVYASRTISQFVLHGNIFDKTRSANPAGAIYRNLPDYLMNTVFAGHDIVLSYDRAGGLSFRDDAVKKDLSSYLQAFDQKNGTKLLNAFPKDPTGAFEVLDRYFHDRLQEQKSIAFLVEYAESIVPASPAGSGNTQDRAVLVQLLKWARDPAFVRNEMALVLMTEKLNDLSAQLANTPYSAALEIGFPGEAERLAYIQDVAAENPLMLDYLEMAPEVLARLTAGLNILQMNILLAYVFRNRKTLTYELLNERKKELIEREAGGLLEFVESSFTLDDVAGHQAAKKQLRAAADAVRRGHLDVLPMGYLMNGPVGTGKTFMVRCFAGDIGIPMVVLKNFRSQWQGVTESNLEKVLGLLKAMSPVAVMIDEADAYLGNRSQGGDSGVGSRVFSMIATFMSNTENRGRIIWFLLTARPDLMPVDLKRQGRAEEHIALFYPETLAEKQEMLGTMLRKTRIRNLVPTDFDDDFYHNLPIRSGADMEAALTRARFLASQRGAPEVTVELVQAAFADFIPPAYPEEVELMTLLAISECTSRDLLPDRYRSLPREELMQRIEELKMRIR
jgi:hypothetical protein